MMSHTVDPNRLADNWDAGNDLHPVVREGGGWLGDHLDSATSGAAQILCVYNIHRDLCL